MSTAERIRALDVRIDLSHEALAEMKVRSPTLSLAFCAALVLNASPGRPLRPWRGAGRDKAGCITARAMLGGGSEGRSGRKEEGRKRAST